MLTVDFSRFPPPRRPRARPGLRRRPARVRVLPARRRGGALDQNGEEIREVAKWFAAMKEAGEAPAGAEAAAMEGDALSTCPSPTEFDVIISEVMEHIPDDKGDRRDGPGAAPGGRSPSPCRATAPRRSAGRSPTPTTRSRAATSASTGADELLGQDRGGRAEADGTHHAHALHSPYWWLKCAFGVDNDKPRWCGRYHKLLVWDIMKKPAGATRAAERALNPLIGKSFVAYATKPETSAA